MDDRLRLIEADKELALAFSYLDRASDITATTVVEIITKEELLLAASQSVAKANAMLAKSH